MRQAHTTDDAGIWLVCRVLALQVQNPGVYLQHQGRKRFRYKYRNKVKRLPTTPAMQEVLNTKELIGHVDTVHGQLLPNALLLTVLEHEPATGPVL